MTGRNTEVRETRARYGKDQGQGINREKARTGKESAGYLSEKTIGKEIGEKRKSRAKSARLAIKLYKLCAEFIWRALKFVRWEHLYRENKVLD